ncbi:uncharacterized protein LY89DRAFT_677692 [Mollisia scopiformis]|uniref:L-tryptophan decarboxylase PsiD-like domain-containing protein n=1 Tax=Mollisia scopiformis TaxID=149040 RepID=A0A132B4X4_MOLSC|nr:uncharacterized protein LY89DRAFT_677692 [Mollisia scopiformis]KUJ07460.1 hypothetical protein LY89DRAFT_677692 [Mollisia scopiformis]
MTATQYPPPERFGETSQSPNIPRHRNWLPGDAGLIQTWVHKIIEEVAAPPNPFVPIISEFQDLIDSDPAIYILFHSMFDEVPPKYKDPELPSNAIQRHEYKNLEGGNATFLNPKVNAMFKKLFNEWAQFLESPDSTTVLNTSKDGWFGPAAMEEMRHASRGDSNWKFEDE